MKETKAVTFEVSAQIRAEVMRITGAKTFTEAVHIALQEVVDHHKTRPTA